MKYLVLLVVILVVLWLWRQGRLSAPPPEASAPPARKPPPEVPQAMVRCAVCALHLPQTDALAGTRGHYCSPEHRRQAEG